MDIDPKHSYLLSRITPTVEDMVGSDASPVAMVKMDMKFFDFVDRRRDLMLQAERMDCCLMSFHFLQEFTNLSVFDPDSYAPNGPDDVRATEKFKKKLMPFWQKLEDDQFAVMSGGLMEELGLDVLEEVPDFITGNEFCTFHMMPTYAEGQGPEEWVRTLFIRFNVELKHSYEPWDGVQINYDELRSLHREAAKKVEQGA